jgi:RNA polymerase sigma factor (sigma-70 family)
MATGTRDSVLGHLRRVVLLRDGGGLTDGELLECFVARHEEAAFEALVRRHGPMVLGVCRRLLPNECDAEDAFQATFLVLARKAAAVVPADLVGNWLHGVAYRTALKAKAATARRRRREKQVTTMPEHPSEPKDVWHDLQPLLDHELQRLPDKYRVPVVLCELEGRTRKQVARQLGIPEGTLSSRLATARKMLAHRLARHGLALSPGSLALLLSQNAASAGVPGALVGSTVTAATLFAAGQATTGVISAKVAALTGGVLKTLLLTELKVATGLLLALGIVGTGAGIIACQTSAAERADSDKPYLGRGVDPAPEVGLPQADQMEDSPKDQKDDGRQEQREDGRKNDKDDGRKKQKDDGDDDEDDDDDDGRKYEGVVKALDAATNTITLTVRRKGKDTDRTFDLRPNVQVRVAGKAANLADVQAEMPVALKLSKDKKAVVEVKEAKRENGKEGHKGNPNAGTRKGGN